MQQLAQHPCQRIDARRIKVRHAEGHRVHLIGRAHRADVGHPQPQAVATKEDILAARQLVKQVYVDERVREYIVNLVLATRDPGSIKRSDLVGFVEVGASPRASIGLAQASKAHAFIQGRAYVTPEDVKAVAMEVLRHRIILSYEAEAEEVSAETVVQKILDSVEVP